jgi:hypothetical protein
MLPMLVVNGIAWIARVDGSLPPIFGEFISEAAGAAQAGWTLATLDRAG